MFNWWKKRRRNKILAQHPIAEGEWQDTVAQLPLLQQLSPAQLAELRAMTTWFLHDKDFYGGGDMDVVRPMQLLISAQSCLPALTIGYEWLEGWYSIFVFPGAFSNRQSWRNHMGLVEDEKRVLAGAAHQKGGMVLSGITSLTMWLTLMTATTSLFTRLPTKLICAMVPQTVTQRFTRVCLDVAGPR